MAPHAESAPDSATRRRSSARPRLFIKEMVMRNFKSYAGEQRVGPFHKSFSAVVGPNGSGKSNVIDAMLFVFGKRAKQMRLNKVSELIHNSTNHQNLDSAGVSVHFQEIVDSDDGTYEAVAGSDFVITRVAFRDNSSKYYINDRTSNFTEVTKKLKGKGVDLDNNRFLILQGEVEQISLMKPKAQGPHDEGFLEYLEDIIGTNKYVEKIDESHKLLESLNEKRSGVVQMVKLSEKERDSLEDVKNEAEAYMLKELSLLKWQEKATKLALDDTGGKMDELQGNVATLEESLKAERDKIQDSKQTLKELETTHNNYMKRQEELDNDMRKCKEEFKEFERQDVKYREDFKHVNQKIKKLEDKVEKDSSKIEALIKEGEESTVLIPKLEDNIPKLQKLLLDEEKVLEEITESSKAKYDVAISTACHGLDYIVVETTNAAQACVELLRRENLGVATFMILEKQVDLLPKLKKNVSTPEGVPRLFDLVKVQDERMKLAFFAALRNTVVAKDLDQATRIAYGGNTEFRRVVTLDGALFENSGTMSGGGGKPRGGKMGTSIRATSVSVESVANAEKELSRLTDKLNDIRQRIMAAVQRYQASEKAVAALEMELAKSQKEVDSLNSQYNYIEKQLDSLEAASTPQEDELDRLKELKKIVSAEEREINRLNNGSKQLKEKALELQRNLENVGGEKLKSQKSKVQKIQSDIDRNSSEINRHKVQIETGQKMVKKLTKGIEDSKKEKDRLTEQKEKLTQAFKEIEQKAFVVQENYKKTQKVIDEHMIVLEKAKSEYNKMKKVMDELRASEVDAEFKLKDMKKAYKELEMKGKGYKKRLDDLQTALHRHIEQIQADLVDQEKLQATLADEHLNAACDLKKACEMVALLEAQLKEMNPNLDSISEYRKKVSSYNERVEELNAVTQERDDIKKQYDEWRKKRLDEFMEGFNAISLKLKEMYQMITLGGDAELELVDSLDPFSEGVVFSVRPPKKSWKNIANLSGGEKTLSSLALVFALHHYKPTPLYVMDEIDAALDFKNVSIVGHYVKDRTKDAQFIIISLRNNMFELADRLVGIYKTDNCTKSITINPGSFVVCEKAV
ncbi:structural maintenance of chromosomes protein 4-like isoform X2 [Glycine soja]|uniref:structural maintenance of chromosomes protein 4-like isoform X2 n=1 Tax=Glycine soja TaxID=3848 RepID=UPI00103A343F|nr:structural maintenance of chromosomes protein 4-like isoform X2 [Glycine soja]